MRKILYLLLIFNSAFIYPTSIETILKNFDKVIQIPNLTGDFEITLVSKNGDTRKIKAKAYQKLLNENQMNRLFVFNYPPSVRDTSLLIHSYYIGDENKMWIYLPVVKRVKRIELQSSGGGYFMGTDFSYRDFISKSTSEFNQDFVGEGELDGRECYIIKEYGDSKKKKEALGYEYIVTYYGKEDHFLYGKDYYEFSGDLLKTYRVKETSHFNDYIYPTRIEMTNVQTDHKSIINVTNLTTKELSEKIFSTRNLKK